MIEFLLTVLFVIYAVGALVIAPRLLRELPEGSPRGGIEWFAAVMVCMLWPVYSLR